MGNDIQKRKDKKKEIAEVMIIISDKVKFEQKALKFRAKSMLKVLKRTVHSEDVLCISMHPVGVRQFHKAGNSGDAKIDRQRHSGREINNSNLFLPPVQRIAK